MSDPKDIPTLAFRIAVDRSLFHQAAEALCVMEMGMLENKGPLTPDRRTALLDVISLLQADGPE